MVGRLTISDVFFLQMGVRLVMTRRAFRGWAGWIWCGKVMGTTGREYIIGRLATLARYVREDDNVSFGI